MFYVIADTLTLSRTAFEASIVREKHLPACGIDIRPHKYDRTTVLSDRWWMHGVFDKAGRSRLLVVTGSRPIIWFGPALILLFAVTLYPTAVVVWLSLNRTRYYDVIGWVGARQLRFCADLNRILGSHAQLPHLYGGLSRHRIAGRAVLRHWRLQTMKRGASYFRVLLLLPWTLSMGVVGCFWLWLLNPSYGPISYAMKSTWTYARPDAGRSGTSLCCLLIVVTAWWSFPYVMVMMSAACKAFRRTLRGNRHRRRWILVASASRGLASCRCHARQHRAAR